VDGMLAWTVHRSVGCRKGEWGRRTTEEEDTEARLGPMRCQQKSPYVREGLTRRRGWRLQVVSFA
jgi:hypothetical protein